MEATKEIRNYDSARSAYIISATESARGRNGRLIIGASPVMLGLFEKTNILANLDVSVIIKGESGTGKELFAKALHYNGARRAKTFAAVNCAAIPSDLLESTLFGYVKGAFTDAKKDRIGEFENANGGTIFLDEIQSMPVNLQAKLLRVLQDGELKRVGDTKPISTDVRVIAATNIDLLNDVEARRFREDLYYRLNAIPMQIPPLRERMSDMPLLVDVMIKRYNEAFSKGGISISALTPEAMEKLQSHDWPGNVRQLENVMQRAFLLARSDRLCVKDITFTDREFEKVRSPVPKGSVWYDEHGGVFPIAVPELMRELGFNPRHGGTLETFKKRLEELKVHKTDVGATTIVYLTRPALASLADRIGESRWLSTKFASAEFGEIVRRPFLMTNATMLAAHPSTYKNEHIIASLARRKLNPNQLVYKGNELVFVLYEDDANIFVAQSDGEARALKAEALKGTIRKHYKSFVDKGSTASNGAVRLAEGQAVATVAEGSQLQNQKVPEGEAAGRQERMWFDGQGGLIPIAMPELVTIVSSIGNPETELYKKIKIDGKLEKLMIYTTPVGNRTKVVWLTKRGLDKLVDAMGREGEEFLGLQDRISTSTWEMTARKPFLITDLGELRAHPATFKGSSNLGNAVRYKLSRELMVYENSNVFIFGVREEDAEKLVPQRSVQRAMGRADALRQSMRTYHEAFRNRVPVSLSEILRRGSGAVAEQKATA